MQLTRENVILAVLAAGEGGEFTPVQVQKLLFLLDKRISDKTGGPHFNFVPYDYGPFDATIYADLEKLASNGAIIITRDSKVRWSKYRPTETGLAAGQKVLQDLQETGKYIGDLTKFVRKLCFAELVGAIYRAYPEMKVNSVFKSA